MTGVGAQPVVSSVRRSRVRAIFAGTDAASADAGRGVRELSHRGGRDRDAPLPAPRPVALLDPIEAQRADPAGVDDEAGHPAGRVARDLGDADAAAKRIGVHRPHNE